MNALISVTALKPRHSADNAEVVIGELFLTTDHQLMLKGHCSQCLRDVTILIPLTELMDECPEDLTADDIAELHAMHITLPDPS